MVSPKSVQKDGIDPLSRKKKREEKKTNILVNFYFTPSEIDISA